MKPWEHAVDIFLRAWTDKDEVVGAMACGSYVTGNPTDRSDVDLHIILASDVDWRERGNKYVEGFLIEYFANPPGQIEKYFAEDYADRQTASMVQFMTGIIIFDRLGTIEQLKQKAKAWKAKVYPTPKASQVEIKKYSLWDAFDNFLDCYENHRVDFDFVYYQSLLRLFQGYCFLLNLEQIPFDHIMRYLSDHRYLDKYIKCPFPDREFSLMFLEAMQCKHKDKKIQLHEALLKRVFQKTGGFEIDGWSLKSPVDS